MSLVNIKIVIVFLYGTDVYTPKPNVVEKAFEIGSLKYKQYFVKKYNN